MEKPLKKVAASVVTYNTDSEELEACIRMLGAAGIGRVTVVDNSPSDALKPICGRHGAEYVQNGKNLGYGAAHNVAIRKSLADPTVAYHLVVNSDIAFDSGAISAIVGYMDTHGDVGQLTPKIVYPDGRIQASVRLLPTPFDLILRRFFPSGWFRKSRARYTLENWSHDTELDIAYHQGSFMFLRTDALREVGLFDERFFMYPEDIDLTRRMHRRWRTVFWPGAVVIHNHRQSSYRSLKMLWVHLWNMTKYFNKWGWIFDGERRSVNREVLAALSAGMAVHSSTEGCNRVEKSDKI